MKERKLKKKREEERKTEDGNEGWKKMVGGKEEDIIRKERKDEKGIMKPRKCGERLDGEEGDENGKNKRKRGENKREGK